MTNEAESATPTPLPEPVTGPDFRHVGSWIFDLDHTLYSANDECQKAVEQRICQFVQRHLDLPWEPAWEIQKRYLREMGSTLSGLVKHHGADPDAYHDFVNDLDELNLGPQHDLRQALERLPGRKFIFTNNCGRFARQVLEMLAIRDLFEDIVDAKILRFEPKPMQAAYDTLVIRTGIAPRDSAIFDDSTRNLVPAHAMGMTTVWFKGNSPWTRQGLVAADTNHIHHETDDLVEFLQGIRI